MNPAVIHNRHSPGRLLMALAVARGRPDAAAAYAQSQNWHDAGQIVPAIRALASAAYGDGDFPTTLKPIADAFLATMRPYSIPLRLHDAMSVVPMRTRVFVSGGAVTGSETSEGGPIPVLRSTWTAQTLLPRRFAAMSVKTNDLVRSSDPAAGLAIADELAEAVAAAENYAFLAPGTANSVLAAAPNFVGTGSTTAALAADLLRLASIVPGAARGGVYVMHPLTSTFLGLLFGSGGAPAFPGLGPAGGMLNGLPVFTSTALELVGSPTGRAICLLSPAEIIWSDGGVVRFSVSTTAAIQMLDNPTNTSTGSTTATTLISMMQVDSVALRAVRESDWYARSGSAGYFTTAF